MQLLLLCLSTCLASLSHLPGVLSHELFSYLDMLSTCYTRHVPAASCSARFVTLLHLDATHHSLGRHTLLSV